MSEVERNEKSFLPVCDGVARWARANIFPYLKSKLVVRRMRKPSIELLTYNNYPSFSSSNKWLVKRVVRNMLWDRSLMLVRGLKFGIQRKHESSPWIANKRPKEKNKKLWSSSLHFEPEITYFTT